MVRMKCVFAGSSFMALAKRAATVDGYIKTLPTSEKGVLSVVSCPWLHNGMEVHGTYGIYNSTVVGATQRGCWPLNFLPTLPRGFADHSIPSSFPFFHVDTPAEKNPTTSESCVQGMPSMFRCHIHLNTPDTHALLTFFFPISFRIL